MAYKTVLLAVFLTLSCFGNDMVQVRLNQDSVCLLSNGATVIARKDTILKFPKSELPIRITIENPNNYDSFSAHVSDFSFLPGNISVQPTEEKIYIAGLSNLRAFHNVPRSHLCVEISKQNFTGIPKLPKEEKEGEKIT